MNECACQVTSICKVNECTCASPMIWLGARVVCVNAYHQGLPGLNALRDVQVPPYDCFTHSDLIAGTPSSKLVYTM